MRKTTTLKTLAAAALTIMAASCAKEQLADNGGQSGVSFTVEVPGAPATKAIGDGTTAKALYYQVFDNNGEPISGLGVQTTTFGTDGKAKVSFQLVKDQTYNFIFWAQTDAEGYYTIGETETEKDLRTITAKYDGKKANDENFDAFFAVEKEFKVSGPVTKDITLKRPFAQINIASNDRISAGGTPQTINFEGAKSEIAIKGIPTTFSPLTGALAGAGESYVEFAEASAPLNEVKVNEVTYTNLAMNYVFAPADGAVCDIKATFTVDGKNVLLSVPNAPIKRNWRTNIVGNILTSEADFNVVIDTNFDGDNNTSWDGNTLTPVTPTADGVYEIKTAAELAWIAQQVNLAQDGSHFSFWNKTVKLMNDISLDGFPWTPIGDVNAAGTIVYFDGVLDGDGHTVSGLNVKRSKRYQYGGLVGALTGTIKNLTVKNAKVEGVERVGVVCGFAQQRSGGPKIINCHVSNAEVTVSPAAPNNRGDKGGAVCGYIAGGTLTECSADNVTITGYKDLGGITGCIEGGKDRDGNYDGVKISNNQLGANIVINVDNSNNHENFAKPADYLVGPYVGRFSTEGILGEGNTGAENVIINYPPITIADNATFASSFASIEDGSTIALASGTYTIPTQKALKNVTFVGNGETVIDLGSSNDCPTGTGKSYDNVTFKNIKFITWSSDYKGFQHSDNLVFEDCTFTGKHFSYGTETYKDCKFIQTVADYNIWTYSGAVSFENCEFDCQGKAVLIYNEQNQNSEAVTEPLKINFNNCTFTAHAKATTWDGNPVGAIEIDSSISSPFEVTINNCTATGFNYDSSIYRVKKQKYYTSIELDGQKTVMEKK